MRELEVMDLTWIVRRLPKDVATMMKTRGGEMFLAGGFVRACIAQEEVNDIDLFTPTKELAECGCMTTTDAYIEVLGIVDRRIVLTVDHTYCEAHRAQYQASGKKETSTFRGRCKLCRFSFWMGIAAWVGWMVTGFLLMLKL